jgi:hypothetical protein
MNSPVKLLVQAVRFYDKSVIEGQLMAFIFFDESDHQNLFCLDSEMIGINFLRK